MISKIEGLLAGLDDAGQLQNPLGKAFNRFHAEFVFPGHMTNPFLYLTPSINTG